VTFKNCATRDIYNGERSRAARNALPPRLHEKAARLLDRILAIRHPADLSASRGIRLHRLTGRREGLWSMSISKQYRITFAWVNDEPVDIEISDYH